MIRLTPKEVEALELSALGMTDRQIGRKLGVRPGTINARAGRAQAKLGAQCRAHAVALLIKSCVIRGPKPVEVRIAKANGRPLAEFAEDYRILMGRGMTRREIAEVFGIKPDSVERQVGRARKAGLLPPVGGAAS